MNDFKDQFKLLRDDLVLSNEERSRMRALVMTERTMPTVTLPALPSPFFSRISFALAALVLVVSGGSIAGASGALPGDTLYGVKLGVNERIERIATIGTVAKAEVDVRHAEERIQEVELLAAKGDTDTRAVGDIAKAIDGHIKLASDAAAALSEKGDTAQAALVAARIDAALSSHAELLEAQAENEDEQGRRKLRALSVALSVTAKERAFNEDETQARTGDYYERTEELREAEADKRLRALKEALERNGVAPESITELEAEYAALKAEFDLARMSALEDGPKDAAETYAELGKRAYRAYTLMTSASRIADETDKEVVVSLIAEGAIEPYEPPTTEAEATLLMTGPVSDMQAREEYDGPTLQFYLRERSD